MHRIGFALLLLVAPFSFAAAARGASIADCSLVPGWQQAGPTRRFTTDNLYDYMDGSSESYFAYGFVEMQGVTCKHGENTFVIDVSEMIDADAAYGIFSANKDPKHPEQKLGMGGQIIPRRATFAKARAYVEIAATPDIDHSADLSAFVGAMEKLIDGRSTPPEALSWFPPKSLVSVRLIPESVLGIRILKRGYVAEYDRGKAFLILESSPQSAAAVMAKLRQRYPDAQPAVVGDEAIQLQDKYLSGVCFFRKGKYVAGYANQPAAGTATQSSVNLATRLP